MFSPINFSTFVFYLWCLVDFARSQATYTTSLGSFGDNVASVSVDYSTGIVYAGGGGGIFYISGDSPPVPTTIIAYQECVANFIYVHNQKLYASCSGAGVMVVSLPSYQITTLASSSVCPATEGLYVDSTTDIVYVACFGNGPEDGKVISINGSSITTIANSSVCSQPNNVIKAANGIVYVACYNSGLISINRTAVTSIADATQCDTPNSLTVNGNTVYATCFGGTNTGLVISYSPSSQISAIVGASAPSCIYANGIDYVNGTLYVACIGENGVPNGDGTIMSVDVQSGYGINSFTTNSQCIFPSCVYVNTITGVIYACCEYNLISITVCPLGSYCPVGSVGATICPVGSYCPQKGLYSNILCAAGFYCPLTNSSSIGPICPAGSFCPQGSSNSTYCSAGFYCPSTGLSAPIPCPAGYSCPEMNSSSVGPACSIGFYCGEKTTYPQLCPQGNYCPNPSTIIPCPAGHYCSNGLSAVGPACLIGNYCPVGSSAEAICSEGYYCPDVTSQIACSPTYVCSETGSTSPGPKCTDPGYYSTGIACIACDDTTDTSHILSCSANYMCSNCKDPYLIFNSPSITYSVNYFYSFECALCSRPLNSFTITKNPASNLIYKCDSSNNVELTSDVYYECLNMSAEIYISYFFIALISILSVANLIVYIFVYPKAYKSTKDFSLLLLWIDGSSRILDYLYYIQTDIENYTLQTIYFYSYFAPILICLILFFILWCYKGEFAPSTKGHFRFVSSPFDYPFNSLKLWTPIKRADSLEKFLIFCIVGFVFVMFIWLPMALLCSFLLIESFPQLWALKAMMFEKDSKEITSPHKGLQQLFLSTSCRYASFLSLNYSVVGVLPRLIIQVLNYLEVSNTISTITILTFVKTGYLLSRNVFAQCYACCFTVSIESVTDNNISINNKNNNISNVIDVQVPMEQFHMKSNIIDNNINEENNLDEIPNNNNPSPVQTGFSDSDQAELDAITSMMDLQRKRLQLLQQKRRSTGSSES